MTHPQKTGPSRTLHTINEAAELLGVQPQTITARIKDGTLPAYNIGPRDVKRPTVRIVHEDLMGLLRRIN